MDNNIIYDWIKSNYMDKVRGLHPIWHDFEFEKNQLLYLYLAN